MKPLVGATQHRMALPPSTLILLAGLTLGWGFNWTVIKVVLGEMTPLTFRFYCLLGASLGLFALVRASGLPLRVPQAQWPRLVMIGFFNITLWNVLVVYGVRLMDSGRAAILTFTLPVWAILLGLWLLDERMDRRKWMALGFGVMGILLLLAGELRLLGQSPLGTALMLCAAMSWAAGTVCTKRWPVDLPASSLTAWQLLLAVVPFGVGTLIFEPEGMALDGVSASSIAGILYNILVSFIFCMWAWTRVVVSVPVAVSSLSPLLIPVIGVFSGMLILGEQPRWTDFVALVLVIAALVTVMFPGKDAGAKAA